MLCLLIQTRHDGPNHHSAHHSALCHSTAQHSLHNSFPWSFKSLAGLCSFSGLTGKHKILSYSRVSSFQPDILDRLTICLPISGCGVGHIWLYNTKDWSCHRMEGGLLRPPVACCFCDWSDLTQPPQLFVASGPSSAMQCLPVPDVSQVQPLPVCELHHELCAGQQFLVGLQGLHRDRQSSTHVSL